MHSLDSRFIGRLSGVAASLVLAALACAAEPPTDQPASGDEQQPYLRVVEQRGKSIALEIATTEYTRAGGSGPKVALVGVAHIADQSFFDSVAQLLKRYDVVLYESVKPEGTGGAGGETHEQRVASTKSAMQFVAGMLATHHADRGTYPANLDALQEFAAVKDSRLPSFIQSAIVDGWGNALVYGIAADVDGNVTAYSLTSLGADGKPAGKGEDADISLADLETPEPLALNQDDGLQSQLAAALKLRFQLDSLPYESANWRCSDMAMDELNRRFAAKGLDFGMIGGSLAGTSWPAAIIKVLLGFIKMLDAMAEGVITDTFKVIMIEMLGDPTLLEMGLGQLGKGFEEVIVGDRNQVVVDDLKRIIEKEPQVKSIALLYGAAHMPDMAARLKDQLAYVRDDSHETEWLPAIRVDLANSKVPAAQIDAMRKMVKQAIRQQMRRAR